MQISMRILISIIGRRGTTGGERAVFSVEERFIHQEETR